MLARCCEIRIINERISNKILTDKDYLMRTESMFVDAYETDYYLVDPEQ